MLQLTSGNFFGVTDQTIQTDGLTLTTTKYTHSYVDWHHHQNAYFTFILSGRVVEGSKKGKLNLSAGSLLFHHAQEPHYNIKPKGETFGMHLELAGGWIDNINTYKRATEGSFEICCPKTKILFYRIFKETQMVDELTPLAVQQLMFEAMDDVFKTKFAATPQPPWLKEISDVLNDSHLGPPTLNELAAQAGVHPVHLSRTFTRYFGCTMVAYIRRLRVTKAMAILANGSESLAAVAHASGFADQSHMIRCFKELVGKTPSNFRQLLTC